MKKIFSLLVLSLVLISCTSKNDLFTKKQECAKYNDKMLEIAQKNITPINFNGDVGKINDIFFSEEGNSCYFEILNNDERFLFDYFSQKLIVKTKLHPADETKYCNNDKDCIATSLQLYTDESQEYFKRLKELKGE